MENIKVDVVVVLYKSSIPFNGSKTLLSNVEGGSQEVMRYWKPFVLCNSGKHF